MNLFPEFERNARSRELQYDLERILDQQVVIIGANSLSEQIVEQLLVFGFRNVYVWSHERSADGLSKATELLRSKEHISPYFRNVQGYNRLAAYAISTSFDALGFKTIDHISPTIVINTENNAYLSDVLATRFKQQGLYIDAHTISDHNKKLYGMNIQCLSKNTVMNDFQHMESRDLSLFDVAEHDPLLSKICASYVGAFAARYALKDDDFFCKPTSFTLFPFADNPLRVGEAHKEVHYKGFFKDKRIYLAGLGGGSLMLDALVNIFNVDMLWGVDKDRLERTNLNRLIPFINDRLVGKMKTEAARLVYGGRGDLRFVNGVIDDDLLIGDEQNTIDIMLGMLSGFDNKLNLIALSQKLSAKKPHLLVDVGVEPFRFDITNYLVDTTPCDHCRNLHDLAITEYLAGHVPNCDSYVPGSTIFANSLGVLAIVEAMKYVDPALGSLVTGSVSGDLLPALHDPFRLYAVKQSRASLQCRSHMRTEPLRVDMSRFALEEGFDQGWNSMRAYELPDRRLIGTFRYIPGVRND